MSKFKKAISSVTSFVSWHPVVAAGILAVVLTVVGGSVGAYRAASVDVPAAQARYSETTAKITSVPRGFAPTTADVATADGRRANLAVRVDANVGDKVQVWVDGKDGSIWRTDIVGTSPVTTVAGGFANGALTAWMYATVLGLVAILLFLCGALVDTFHEYFTGQPARRRA